MNTDQIEEVAVLAAKVAAQAVIDARPQIRPEFLNTLQASEYTGVSAPKLAALRRTRYGCCFVKHGRSIRYKRSDLDDWLCSMRVPFESKPTSEEEGEQ